MQSVGYRTTIMTPMKNVSYQRRQLVKIAQRWDRRIRRELLLFAKKRWPDTHLLGLIPLRSFRLRRQLNTETITWWIERDIPPFDCYRCEAFRVELSLRGSTQPRLVVRSGISAYPVIPMSIDELKISLIRASVDTPLLIRRQFGSALDP